MLFFYRVNKSKKANRPQDPLDCKNGKYSSVRIFRVCSDIREARCGAEVLLIRSEAKITECQTEALKKYQKLIMRVV